MSSTCSSSSSSSAMSSSTSSLPFEPVVASEAEADSLHDPNSPTSLIFNNQTDHMLASFETMNQMRKAGQLCDVTLLAEGVELVAHRLVLASSSAYFSAMFNNDMIEKRSRSVTIHDVDLEALKHLIEYAYTGQVVISEDNVQGLLQAASLLQILSIREACCDFLLHRLEPSNCLSIRQFADRHACQVLQTTSHKFVLDNFQEVAEREEFVWLAFEELMSLLCCDALNVANEETVFKAALRWIRHDEAKRRQHLGELLRHVRLPLMEKNFLLTQVIDEPMIIENIQAKDLIIEAMRYHLCPEKRIEALETTSTSSLRMHHRRPDGCQPYIVAIGGGSLFTINNECEVYDPRHKTWSYIASTSQKRSRAGVAVHNRSIFAMGGYNGSKDLSSGEVYDIFTDQWQPIANMGTKRSCLGCGQLGGLIYAAGGFDGTSCLSSVEKYDPLIGCWFSSHSLEIRRRYCRLAPLDGCLYVVGGYDGGHCLASVERYDPREGKWHGVSPMLNRRSSCALAALGGHLYAVGGVDGSHCHNSAERYDPSKNVWENIAPMPTRRSTHDLVAVQDEHEPLLYALGGNDGSNSLGTVEIYDAGKNRWSLGKSMSLRRSSIAACVVHCNTIGEPAKAFNKKLIASIGEEANLQVDSPQTLECK